MLQREGESLIIHIVISPPSSVQRAGNLEGLQKLVVVDVKRIIRW